MSETSQTPKNDPDLEFEDRAYPTASHEIRDYLRQQRGLIRAFLASSYGRSTRLDRQAAN